MQRDCKVELSFVYFIMLLGIDLMWEIVENFENKFIINEFSRIQYVDNLESIMVK